MGVGAEVSVGLRTGDTPQKDRQAMRRKPPDILITTPESLYLMVTSQAREILTGVEAVIVDEIHAVAQSKRGAQTRAARILSASAYRPPSGRSSGSPSSWSGRSASARSSTPARARISTSRSSSRWRT
jgi:ATP-dependent helicase Lhr and Lhr-like helicase